MTDAGATAGATHTYRVWIRATPEAIWAALTDPAQVPRYGYRTAVEIDLRPGGAFRHPSSEAMRAAGAPPVMVEGEVLEVDAPRRLVQSWHPLFGPETAAEPATRLTYAIQAGRGGVTQLTVTHEVGGAPIAAAVTSGEEPRAGGGFPFVLSDLKSLLETGSALAVQTD